MNLVMIGRFTDAQTAVHIKEIIDQMTEQVRNDEQTGQTAIGEGVDRYTDGQLALLRKVNVYDVSATEMQQFAYDFSLTLKGSELVLTTNESDVSAFLKILIEGGARVEAYSAHRYADTGYGR